MKNTTSSQERFANEHRRALASLGSDDSTSPLHQTWQGLKGELDEWRSLQDKTVRYPATSAQAHVALGYGELFAYINLIHFMRYYDNDTHKNQFYQANHNYQHIISPS